MKEYKTGDVISVKDEHIIALSNRVVLIKSTLNELRTRLYDSEELLFSAAREKYKLYNNEMHYIHTVNKLIVGAVIDPRRSEADNDPN